MICKNNRVSTSNKYMDSSFAIKFGKRKTIVQFCFVYVVHMERNIFTTYENEHLIISEVIQLILGL